MADDEEGQDRGDDHDQADRDAVGRGQRVGAAEGHHGQRHAREQRPVHHGHVDLPGFVLRGVAHRQARQVSQLDGLLGRGKRAGDQCLRRDDGGGRGQHHHRQRGPAGHHEEERVGGGGRRAEHQRALAQVVQREAGHDQQEPRQPDGARAEVPHVGIERLRAGHAQEDRAQRDEGDAVMVQAECQRVVGQERGQDLGARSDVGDACEPQAGEPHEHGDAEESPEPRRSPALGHEECEQHGERDRQDVRRGPRGDDLQALDGGQHRDRRRDDAVAEEQRDSEDTEGHQSPFEPGLVLHRLRRQGQQRHQAPLAMVVGPHDQGHVLDRDDHRQGPEEEREDADHVGWRDLQPAGGEHLLEGVERRSADVSVHYPDRGDGERRERGRCLCVCHGGPCRWNVSRSAGVPARRTASEHISIRDGRARVAAARHSGRLTRSSRRTPPRCPSTSRSRP